MTFKDLNKIYNFINTTKTIFNGDEISYVLLKFNDFEIIKFRDDFKYYIGNKNISTVAVAYSDEQLIETFKNI